MRKKIIALALCTICICLISDANAQTSKSRKSKYFQNNMKEQDEFNILGFSRDIDKKEVDEKPKEDEYNVNIRQNENESKYFNEKKVVEGEVDTKISRLRRRRVGGYYTTYGNYKPSVEKKVVKKVVREVLPDDREVKMTSAEHEYKTTYVKKRYTNLDVLCDDLDLAKIQRPVFKGICSECSRDVDLIITNKNLSSLEKNYQLKQCYMMRDKRLREILDDDQYKKFLRIKDADEYLVITKDLEQKDGINK
jgi:hypothetical protein